MYYCCCVAWWSRGSSDVLWPQNLGPPPDLTTWKTQFKSRMPKNIYRQSHGKSTYRLNFLETVVWSSGWEVQAMYIGLKIWDLPKNHTMWMKQVWVMYKHKYLQAIPWQKYIYIKFPTKLSCGSMAKGCRWCTLASKIGTFQKILPQGQRRFRSHTPENIYMLPHSKSTYRSNFL